MLKKMLSFDEMLTPVVVKILYILGLVLLGIMGLVMIIAGLSTPYGFGGRMVFMGMFTLLVAPVILRVYVELVLVIFGIHDRLGDIREQTAADSTAGDADHLEAKQ